MAVLSERAKDLVLEMSREVGETGPEEELVRLWLGRVEAGIIEEAAKGGEEELQEMRRAVGIFPDMGGANFGQDEQIR